MPAIHAKAAITIPAGVDEVFATLCDFKNFPRHFTGYGIIPPVSKVELVGTTTNDVGTQRRVTSADGSVLEETVLVFEPPHRHHYELYGFAFPASLMVTRGNSEVHCNQDGDATTVTWHYVFKTASILFYPLAWLVFGFFFERAMKKALHSMAESFATR